MKWRLLLAWGALSIGLAGMVNPLLGQPKETVEILNQYFISSLTKPLVETLLPNATVTISVEPPGQLAEWVQQQITMAFLRKKIGVYKTGSTDVNYRIRISRLSLQIIYQPVSRNWIGRVTQWRRFMQAQGELEMVTSQEKIVLMQPITWAYSDTLQGNPASWEQPSLPFTRGTVRDTSHWRRWVEPILISVATITVVTLFFTIRSQQ